MQNILHYSLNNDFYSNKNEIFLNYLKFYGISENVTFEKYYDGLSSIILSIHNIISLKELQEMPIYKKKILLKKIYKKYDKEETDYVKFKKLIEFLKDGFEALLKKPTLF